jgi:hypothetical protein
MQQNQKRKMCGNYIEPCLSKTNYPRTLVVPVLDFIKTSRHQLLSLKQTAGFSLIRIIRNIKEIYPKKSRGKERL